MTAAFTAMTNTLKTTLCSGALSALLLFLGEALGGAQGLLLAFLFAVGTNFVSYFFSDKIVLRDVPRAGGRRGAPAVRDGGAARAARGAADAAGVHHPGRSPNAFATGRNPQHAAVAATEGILRVLGPEELEGVIAHELAHVKHRDILISSVAATIAAAIMMAARFAMFFGGSRDDRGGRESRWRCC